MLCEAPTAAALPPLLKVLANTKKKMRQWSSSTRWTIVPECPTPPVFLLWSHPKSSRTSTLSKPALRMSMT
jgi:hypothetical protein